MGGENVHRMCASTQRHSGRCVFLRCIPSVRVCVCGIMPYPGSAQIHINSNIMCSRRELRHTSPIDYYYTLFVSAEEVSHRSFFCRRVCLNGASAGCRLPLPLLCRIPSRLIRHSCRKCFLCFLFLLYYFGEPLLLRCCCCRLFDSHTKCTI